MTAGTWRRLLPYLVLLTASVITIGYVLDELPATPSGAAPAASPSPTPFMHSDGLSDSHDGYLIQPVTLPVKRGKAIPVAFRILGPDGLPLLSYETIQTRQLHLYLVRDDASNYQHLHPALADGTWTTTVDVTDGGAYRFYAEFVPRGKDTLGHPTVLGLPFLITGDTKLAPLPAPAPSATVDGFTLTRLDGVTHLRAARGELLRFKVSSAAGPPVLEPHLGAMAHLSAFEVRTLGLTHAHAAADAPDATLTFHVEFANRGEQRLYLEFKVAGTIHRTAFTVFVT
ncbi:hypothetical protein [Catellatospora methionotrophica]|uniref:hypothetical protein n=1 Tax=Catellatospora methionotrophica TaxID=121620 RepID=UPI001EF2EAED|nr:hypothetical protein [Catellatospora methionotrophica]